jgi:phosphoglycerate dehydrogenase-like enzyme
VQAADPSRPAGDDVRDVLVTWPDYDLDHEQVGAALTRAGLRTRLAPKHGSRTPAELLELAAGCVGAIVSTDPFDADVLAALPALRVIARVGVGLDSIDLDAATANGVAVTVTPGANEATVADHTVGMMLGLLRRMVEHDDGVRRGEWNRTGRHMPSALNGRTVGLIGYGRTGGLVAERLRGFDARILVSDPLAPADETVELATLAELLAVADVVSLHCPLLPATRGLLGRDELAAMRPDAILVNTARGGLIDEDALADALERGELRGAALDVFADEPPRSRRLLELPSVLLSPHIAGLSDRSVHEMMCRATASVIDVLRGRQPEHLANVDVLERVELGPELACTPLEVEPDDA